MKLSKLPKELYLNKGIDLSKFAKKYEDIDSRVSDSSSCRLRFSTSIQTKNTSITNGKPLNSARIMIDASKKKVIKKTSNPEDDYLRSLKQSFSPGPSKFYHDALVTSSNLSARHTTASTCMKGKSS